MINSQIALRKPFNRFAGTSLWEKLTKKGFCHKKLCTTGSSSPVFFSVFVKMGLYTAIISYSAIITCAVCCWFALFHFVVFCPLFFVFLQNKNIIFIVCKHFFLSRYACTSLLILRKNHKGLCCENKIYMVTLFNGLFVIHVPQK